MRYFSGGLCMQLLQDEMLGLAWAVSPAGCRPLIMALDIAWTIQYVKSLV